MYYLVSVRKHGISSASWGDKCYKRAECSEEFYKFGSTLPVVNFGGNGKRYDTFIPVIKPTKILRMDYSEMLLKKQKEDEISEVVSLTEWTPALPLVCPVVPKKSLYPWRQSRLK